MIDIAALTSQNFESLVGQVFAVSGDFGKISLKLDNLTLLSEATVRDTPVEIDGREILPRRAFSLSLTGPRQPLLTQRIYSIHMPVIGQAELFLSPYNQTPDATFYEIVFS